MHFFARRTLVLHTRVPRQKRQHAAKPPHLRVGRDDRRLRRGDRRRQRPRDRGRMHSVAWFAVVVYHQRRHPKRRELGGAQAERGLVLRIEQQIGRAPARVDERAGAERPQRRRDGAIERRTLPPVGVLEEAVDATTLGEARKAQVVLVGQLLRRLATARQDAQHERAYELRVLQRDSAEEATAARVPQQDGARQPQVRHQLSEVGHLGIDLTEGRAATARGEVGVGGARVATCTGRGGRAAVVGRQWFEWRSSHGQR
mmetsp:Transcript_30066/g.87979  ORF Transcript_30066/g.87979 Transcript_30066/m.87979 type:complete len:258 (+) Transcript_30066:38-811(+)